MPNLPHACKEIRIPESGKFLLLESGILGSGIQNTAQGIRISLTIGIQDQSSTDKESRIQYLESWIQDCLDSLTRGDPKLFLNCK